MRKEKVILFLKNSDNIDTNIAKDHPWQGFSGVFPSETDAVVSMKSNPRNKGTAQIVSYATLSVLRNYFKVGSRWEVSNAR